MNEFLSRQSALRAKEPRQCLIGIAVSDADDLPAAAAAAATGLCAGAYSAASPSATQSAARLVVRAATVEDVAQGLASYASGVQDPYVKASTSSCAAGVAFVFSGQGDIRVGMGDELYRESPVYTEIMNRCSATVGEVIGTTLASALYTQGNASVLNDARVAQPALFALQCGLAGLWRRWGVAPGFVAGHSLGEYAAAVVAGVMDIDDGTRLVAARGRITQARALPGCMAAVFASESWVEMAVARQGEDVSIAAINAPGMVVVSGEHEHVAGFLAFAGREGVRTITLDTSHPFHSRCIDPVLPDLARAAAKVSFARPRIGFASTVKGRLLAEGEVPDAAYWCSHAREPVQFRAAMHALRQAGCTVFLEIGPHTTLARLGERCVASWPVHWLPSLKRNVHDLDVLADTATELWLAGVDVDLATVARSAGWKYL